MALTFKDSFSFRNNSILDIEITDILFLRIERVGQADARLHFVDDTNAEVDIPHGLEVRDETHGARVQPLLNNQYFILAWTDSYTVLSQRQWAISAPQASHIRTLEV